MRSRAPLLFCAILAGCGGSTEPHRTLADLAGTYQLSAVGGNALPAYLHESVIDPNYGPQFIVGGSFTISDVGGDTREATRVEIIQNGTSGTWRDTVTTAGAVTLDVSNGQSFIFMSGTTALHGAISPQQATLYTSGEAGYRRYTR